MRSLVALNHPALRAYSELPHDNTRAAGASHALLHAHRVKTARTSPRARKHAQRHFRAVPCASALCWRPMAVPRRPHQLRAPRTTRASRISTHAATRAPQHTSPAHLRLFAPCAGSADCFWHPTSGCTRTRRECDGTAQAQARTRARTRARSSAQSAVHSLSACLHTQHTAPSARVLHTAPLPPRACLHCTRRARGTLRARTPARARARAQPLSAAQTASLPAHTAYSTMGTHTPNDAARTPQQ